MDQISYGEPCLYQGEFIRCQSDHGNYACSHGRVAMSVSDGTGSSTRVLIYQVRVGACGYVLSCLALNCTTFEDPVPVALTWY
jgi:hypothetical protein